MTKKRLILSIVTALTLLIVLVLLLPWALGYLIQSHYHQMLAAIAKSGSVELRLVDYQRGWFSSKAVIEAKPTSAALLHLSEWSKSTVTPSIIFLITQDISHGPLLKVKALDGTTHWLIGRALIDTAAANKLGAIQSITLIRLNGSLLSSITAPELHYLDLQSKLALRIKRLVLSLNVSSNFKKVKLHLNLPQLSLQTADFLQTINGLSAQYDLSATSSGLFLGKKLTVIDRVDWQTPDNQGKAEAKGLFIETNSLEKNGKVSYEINTVISHVKVNDTDYGSQEIKVSVNHIDAATLLKLSALLNNLRNSKKPPQQWSQYQILMTQLAHNGLDVNIKKIFFNTAWGRPQLTGRLYWLPSTTEEAAEQSLLNNLQANLHLQLPAYFLNTVLQYALRNKEIQQVFGLSEAGMSSSNIPLYVQQLLNKWVHNGWLIPVKDVYRVDLVYENQQLLINEKPYS